MLIERLSIGRKRNLHVAQRRNGINAHRKLATLTYQTKRQLRTGVLHHAQFAVGQEVLHKDFLFVRRKPGEIRLVVGKDPSHQFNIRTVVIGKVTIPGNAKVAIAPGPLFFPWRNVVVSHM